MHIALTADQERVRAATRVYFQGLLGDGKRAAYDAEVATGVEAGPEYRRLIRQMGKDGWLAVGWPVEFGGRGYGPVEQLIFLEETQRARAPYPFVTLSTVGPALMAHGSDAQKRRFLPGIAAGEIHFAIGYTEPGSGTDLASLRSTAVRRVDGGFTVNGQKIYTSHAEGADFIWFAARTDPDRPRHKGLSILIVDTSRPGFSATPIHTVGGMRTNATFYDDVVVDEDMLVGEWNGGWKLITSQLNHERIGLAARNAIGEALFDRVLAWARTPAGNRRPIDDPTIQALLGECEARLHAVRSYNYRLASEMAHAEPSAALASSAKIFGTDTMIEVCRLLLEVLGMGGLYRSGSPAALIGGDVEQYYRKCQINTFGGGTAEVLRDIVAQHGLGTPRVVR
ncbi:acyl-CoA dehydrogenase [Sphingomonas sp. So64.6b]|uniref:acyl-CoA dehydrogenase family protein n=1 Tax=Sphingomonas sp. So64.6b TaxID=2997354 RepID=UPI001600EB69|nr:acyl-CoA dehydrogenase family protein [Sphingomonas sp. So64.6b]QNA86639.1 acyl-CoA dehydrogenase [Sphingomonas sp. So64.6b]